MEQEKIISRFSGKETKASHFLVELVFMRKAKKEKKFLPAQFWNSPLWKVEYKRQIMAASNLLKYFPFKDIVATLDVKKNEWINSLQYPGLIDLIKEHQAQNKVVEIKIEKSVTEFENVDTTKIAKVQPKPNIISRLRDLDE